MSSYIKLKLRLGHTVCQVGNVDIEIVIGQNFYKGQEIDILKVHHGHCSQDFASPDIEYLEVGHDILLILEEELRKVSFDVKSPENDILLEDKSNLEQQAYESLVNKGDTQ